MRLLWVFRKSFKEQTRDVLVLALTLVFAPAFVYLYTLFFPSGSTTYGVLLLNNDLGVQLEDGSTWFASESMTAQLKEVTYSNGQPMLVVKTVEDRSAAEEQLRDREAAVLAILPADFSATLLAAQQGEFDLPTHVIFAGDLTNPYYAVAAVMVNMALEKYLNTIIGQSRPVQVLEEPLGASAARSEFEIYVPGLLVFAVIMLIFAVSMAVAREVESGTLKRLQITRMTSLDLLGGMSLVFVLIGIVSVLLTFLTAWVLGFRSQGPLGVAILIGAVTSVSIVGAGLVVAGFSNTVNQAFLIANFPLAFFMFFSGAMFPIPRVTLFEILGHPVGLYDLFPPTHAVVALNKVLTLGVSIEGVIYELSVLSLLSAIYYLFGVWLFKRRHLAMA
jgi:ABC-2 type transport system permease protein